MTGCCRSLKPPGDEPGAHAGMALVPPGKWGVEAVVDKDLTAAVLAAAVNADALLLLTDVQAVVEEFGTAEAHPIRQGTPTCARTASHAVEDRSRISWI